MSRSWSALLWAKAGTRAAAVGQTDPMRLLVLGGTTFVGPAVIQAALSRDWQVTVLHRGRTGEPPGGASSVLGDRTDPKVLTRLAESEYDLVVDSWSGAPMIARDAARALRACTGRWAYVSTRSVYDEPAVGADESWPVVAADPDAEASGYPQDKRGAELAYERELGVDRVVHLRAGLILGPRENIDRLPWWLRRVARGGEFLAPGPVDLPLQYVDARDLAQFALDCLIAGRSGPVDTVSPPGHTTTGALLAACVEATGAAASPVWVDPQWLLDRGVEPWSELPVWIPREHDAYSMHSGNTARAAEWGLGCRPAAATVRDTWRWMQSGDTVPLTTSLAGPVGMSPDREAELLTAWRGRAT